ncbi:MBL fold metallo-hydrolase [Synechococcus sp. A10-1-5-1]|uniref:MBL fold metallo-hydrolase n=1 Tax=Synechococcus sp. A10-1-5-1 TaxID=2936507 RepID=UPI0020007F25|nr:MBL fold metallo-hydrolase [Synechococcus sp. A10-1-5-1]UPM49735.1 MBL fold metallo-hydrolase [Synechococcus sp. A10-1-5-1]
MSEENPKLAASGSVFAEPLPEGRPPRQVLENLWLFAPNRDTLGGSAWWLETPELPECSGLLIDCPGLNQANLAFLQQRGPGRMVLTSRDGHGRTRRFQEELQWPVSLQEQEAYLLPTVTGLEPFASEHCLGRGYSLRWTPGPTPGSAVLLADTAFHGGPLLFSGRLLSPVAAGEARPLRTRRSFHWSRWLRSLEALQLWLPRSTPVGLASGAGLGALRGEALIADVQKQLETLDWAALRCQEPI